MTGKHITILGIGCLLFTDQGFGIRIIQTLNDRFDFPDAVHIVDGGLIGVGMVGTIGQSTHLIVIDAIGNNGQPGDLYRLEGRQIFERLAGKNHVPQVEFLEALAHCQGLDHPPHTVLLGIEPEDTRSLACEPTPLLLTKVDAMIEAVLAELDRLDLPYRRKGEQTACA
jgi:hydrogenase maturation protease